MSIDFIIIVVSRLLSIPFSPSLFSPSFFHSHQDRDRVEAVVARDTTGASSGLCRGAHVHGRCHFARERRSGAGDDRKEEREPRGGRSSGSRGRERFFFPGPGLLLLGRLNGSLFSRQGDEKRRGRERARERKVQQEEEKMKKVDCFEWKSKKRKVKKSRFRKNRKIKRLTIWSSGYGTVGHL